MNKWINVKDKLPKIEEDVLMYFSHDNSMAVGFFFGSSGTGWAANTGSEFYTYCEFCPDYWMSLPKLPKGGKENR